MESANLDLLNERVGEAIFKVQVVDEAFGEKEIKIADEAFEVKHQQQLIHSHADERVGEALFEDEDIVFTGYIAGNCTDSTSESVDSFDEREDSDKMVENGSLKSFGREETAEINGENGLDCPPTTGKRVRRSRKRRNNAKDDAMTNDVTSVAQLMTQIKRAKHFEDSLKENVDFEDIVADTDGVLADTDAVIVDVDDNEADVAKDDSMDTDITRKNEGTAENEELEDSAQDTNLKEVDGEDSSIYVNGANASITEDIAVDDDPEIEEVTAEAEISGIEQLTEEAAAAENLEDDSIEAEIVRITSDEGEVFPEPEACSDVAAKLLAAEIIAAGAVAEDLVAAMPLAEDIVAAMPVTEELVAALPVEGNLDICKGPELPLPRSVDQKSARMEDGAEIDPSIHMNGKSLFSTVLSSITSAATAPIRRLLGFVKRS